MTNESEPADLKPKGPTLNPSPAASKDPRQEAHARAVAADAAVKQVLQHFRCRLVPFLATEPVGQEGGKMLVAAAYGIIPDLDE